VRWRIQEDPPGETPEQRLARAREWTSSELATERSQALSILGAIGPVLTDTQDGDDGVIQDGDRGGERPNDQRVVGEVGTAAMKAAGFGSAVMRRALRPGFALWLVIGRHEAGGGLQGAVAVRA
jgi:hypothetical protein